MVKKKKEEQIKATEMLKEEEKLLRAEMALKGAKNSDISYSKEDSSMLSGFDAAEDVDVVFK